MRDTVAEKCTSKEDCDVIHVEVFLAEDRLDRRREQADQLLDAADAAMSPHVTLDSCKLDIKKQLSPPAPDRISLDAAWPDQPAGVQIGRMS